MYIVQFIIIKSVLNRLVYDTIGVLFKGLAIEVSIASFCSGPVRIVMTIAYAATNKNIESTIFN